MKPNFYYKRRGCDWDWTTNHMVAWSWFETGEVVEVIENGSVKAVWGE